MDASSHGTRSPSRLRIDMTTIGFIGSGHIGGTVAGLAVAAGHDVVLSNSRGPETLPTWSPSSGPTPPPPAPSDAAEQGEIVVVSIPLRAYRDVPVEPLAGKIVIDTNNYYWQRDGHFAELDDESTTSAGLLQDHLPTSRGGQGVQPHSVHRNSPSDGQPAGTPDRRALAIAGDDAEAKKVVTALLDSFGYDVVDAGPLAESWRFEPDHPAYGPRLTAEELTRGAG